ncbi:hypothetical protein ZHAS_00005104 [Anopheles sinensis]|uniref:Uncharacterized protein n=1 Tax=Anopheles sinensis TaxID=74873 RepID=A0A084VIP7_ANOSI|nr:hypothetical protein ZHAS_00005104 [Anopheles sinensis]
MADLGRNIICKQPVRTHLQTDGIVWHNERFTSKAERQYGEIDSQIKQSASREIAEVQDDHLRSWNN